MKRQDNYDDNYERHENSGRRKKKHPVLTTFLVILLVCTAAAGIAAVLLAIESGQKGFLVKTTLNGTDVSHKTVQETAQLIQNRFDSCKIIIREKGQESFSGSLSEFGYTLDLDQLDRELERCRKEQRQDVKTVIGRCLNGTRLVTDMPAKFDEAVFNAKVCAASFKEPRFPSEDAELYFDENVRLYNIRPEIFGNEFTDSDLQNYVRKEAEVFATYAKEGEVLTLDLPESIYHGPAVRADNAELTLKRDTYNRYCGSSVTYQFGSQTELLGWDTIREWIRFDNGTGSLDENKISEYVANLAARYDTQYIDRSFHTSVGTDIVIPGGKNEYGYTILQADEAAKLKADIESDTAVTREPVYVETNSFGNRYHLHREGRDDLAGTYVEVNISMQHVWFYKDGQLITESDCVTGCVANGTETHTGVFPLAYKESPSVLRGGNAEGGYETPVTFWMPFTEGQGLHDANWRGSFGGSIYQYSGSHGCVNLPYWAAETIYHNIETATPIIIYR